MIVLDTDTYTLWRHRQAKVVARVEAMGEKFWLTVATQAEVLAGRARSILVADSVERLSDACFRWREELSAMSGIPIVDFDERAFTEWRRLRSEKSLRKVGHADLLIAACALATDATFVTRNVWDYRKVHRLRLENWAD